MDSSEILETSDIGYNDMASDACEGPTDPTSIHLFPYLQDMFLSSDAALESLMRFELPVSINTDSELCIVLLNFYRRVHWIFV
jgi:hypothetical protein